MVTSDHDDLDARLAQRGNRGASGWADRVGQNEETEQGQAPDLLISELSARAVGTLGHGQNAVALARELLDPVPHLTAPSAVE
jgi:hypothetical protein